MRKLTKAFTLIELAVVLLILAFSVTVVFPRFTSGADPYSRLNLSVNRIASVIEYARQLAACTRLTQIFYIDTDKGTYWIASQRLDGQEILIADGLNLSGQLPEGVKFLDVKLEGMNTQSQGTKAIRLSPQGWADPATIILICSTGEIMKIIINEFSDQIETASQKG